METQQVEDISLKDTAKYLREALKKAFPGQKFSVRGSSYSGGSSIRVEWTGGVSFKKVDEIAKQFAGATFDGMQDLKEYQKSLFNGRVVRWGADFVFCERDISEEQKHKIADYLKGYYDIEADTQDLGQSFELLGMFRNWYQLIREYSQNKDAQDFCKGALD